MSTGFTTRLIYPAWCRMIRRKGNRMLLKERIAGVIIGTAVGDALGYPAELLSMDMIKKMHGRVDDFLHHPPKYTEDTQLMRAVAEGLLRARNWDNLNVAAEEIVEEFIAWANYAETVRAPGALCLRGCQNLKNGVYWRNAGKDNGSGCGAAMRAMAYGVWFDVPLRAAEWAAEHALMTHDKPEAQASAAAVAAIVSALCEEYEPVEAVVLGEEVAKRYDANTANMIRDARALVDKTKGQDPTVKGCVLQEVLDRWRGWNGSEAVAASVFCFLLIPRDYREAVLSAVNSPGDSDSLGAITGAFSGAFLGLQAIPTRWRIEIEKTDQLHTLAYRIYKAVNA